jgi:hypothetical protein
MHRTTSTTDAPRTPTATHRSLHDRGPARTPSVAPAMVHSVLQSSGHPLPTTRRAALEQQFGFDFSRVRIHDDAQAAASADAVRARAYTVGRDIVFGAGQYAPQTPAGERLLRHELTHVVQQRQVADARSAALPIRPANDAAERHARAIAERPGASGAIAAHAMPGLQREPAPETAEAPPVEETALARLTVDKTGRVQGWNTDRISLAVFEALSRSPSAYIFVRGTYVFGDTDFDPRVPGDTVRRALIAWLGRSRIPDIERRIDTYYGQGGPFPAKVGGELELEVQHRNVHPGGSGGAVASGHMSAPPSAAPSATRSADKQNPNVETSLKVSPSKDKATGITDIVSQQVEVTVMPPGKGPIKSFTVTVPIKTSGVDTVEFGATIFKQELDSLLPTLPLPSLVFKVAAKGEIDLESPFKQPKFGLYTGIEAEQQLFNSPVYLYGSLGGKAGVSDGKAKVKPEADAGLKIKF